jgi:hypothetical protein
LFDLVIALLTFLFLKETKGLSLEEIAHNDFGKIREHKVIGDGDVECSEHEKNVE